MDPQLWRSARWPLTAIGFALVVALTVPAAFHALVRSVEFHDPDELAKAGPPPEQFAGRPVSDGSAPALADFVARGGKVTESRTPQLMLTPQQGNAVVLAFPRIPGKSTCIGNVWIEMTVLQANPIELGSFGASAYDAGALVDGAPTPAELLVDKEPSWKSFAAAPGRLRWDVTSSYRDFLTNGKAPVGGPFVAAITATRSDQPDAVVRFVASEGRADAPALIWSGVPGCQAGQAA